MNRTDKRAGEAVRHAVGLTRSRFDREPDEQETISASTPISALIGPDGGSARDGIAPEERLARRPAAMSPSQRTYSQGQRVAEPQVGL